MKCSQICHFHTEAWDFIFKLKQQNKEDQNYIIKLVVTRQLQCQK